MKRQKIEKNDKKIWRTRIENEIDRTKNDSKNENDKLKRNKQ